MSAGTGLGGAPFELRLARSGLTLTVGADDTIVEVLERAGVTVPTSCTSGLCGTCKTRYLEGEVEHMDFILEDDERDHCLTPCISRASSPVLVIDL